MCYLTSMGSQSNNAQGESKVVADTSFQASICTFYKRKLLICIFKKQVKTTCTAHNLTYNIKRKIHLNADKETHV